MLNENLSTKIMESSQWTRSEDKIFEEALVIFPEESLNRWDKIAEQLHKTSKEVKEHYEDLVHDVLEIDSGRVEVPDYMDGYSSVVAWDSTAKISFGTKNGDNERKRGTPWSENEHKLFLIGLKRYGKGDWRSISRNVVVTRTPTQVASHAQKYFLRQNSVKKERKRSSIHDITTVDTNLAMPSSNMDYTGHHEHQNMSEFVDQQVNLCHFDDFGF
ncbi:unnamed protein product [Cochlearia groenlandica]